MTDKFPSGYLSAAKLDLDVEIMQLANFHFCYHETRPKN